MQKEYMGPLQEMEYAPLGKQQEERLRELERQFNEEFGTEYYFMVMKRGSA